MQNIKTILHPTDFSPRAEAAFRQACALARAQEALLVVLHVAPPPIHPWAESTLKLYEPSPQWRAAEKCLHNHRAPGVRIKHLLLPGEPGEEILRAAEAVKADLIVMGEARPRTWRWPFPMSVLDYVLRHAPCEVLVASQPQETATEAPEEPAGTKVSKQRQPALNAR